MMPDSNDDKTVFPASPQAATNGFAADNALPVGTRLGEFEILELIGAGGFGIVYLCLDHSLGRRVAIKEYMPQALASRGAGMQVGVHSARHAETFEAGRRSFVNEARLLAQFDHASLVKVYRFWEANGTAYMAMPFYKGRTLKDALKAWTSPPDLAWLTRLLNPMLDALEVIHESRVYHRDIAPDNIMLLAGDRPLLLDFGAARHVISDMTQSLYVTLKSGYAPVEQYAEVPDLNQGAWTDIYALAAVVHFAMTGTRPAPSIARLMNDSQVPLAQQVAGQYPDAFLRAVDRGLAVLPADRPQTITEFRSLLALPQQAPDKSSPGKTAAPSSAAGPPSPRIRAWAWGIGAGVSLSAAAGAAWLMLRESGLAPSGPVAASAHARAASARASAIPKVVPAGPAASEVRAPPSDFLHELDRIFEERDREHFVGVTLPQSQVRIDLDKLRFSVRSSKGGYLYVLLVGTDRQQLALLFPNQVDADNYVAAGGRIDLPRKGWLIDATGEPGTNQLVAVVSEARRDFSGVGLVSIDPFAVFPPDALDRAGQTAGGKASPFLGKPICTDRASTCSSAYGAAEFTIEQVKPR